MNGIKAISDLKEIKMLLQDQLDNIAEGFVSIGFYLKYTRDNELYKQEGHEDIYAFAAAVFNLSRTTALRFMQVNDEYSIDGNSPEIDERYRGYGSSKLTEMLQIPKEIREEIPPEATRSQIREIKREIKGENEVCAGAQSIENTECEGDWKEQEKALEKILKSWLRTDGKPLFEELYELAVIKADKWSEEELNFQSMLLLAPSKFRMIMTEEGRMMLKEDGLMLMVPGLGNQKLGYKNLIETFVTMFFCADGPEAAYMDVYGIPLKEPKIEKDEKKESIQKQKKKEPIQSSNTEKKEVEKGQEVTEEPEKEIEPLREEPEEVEEENEAKEEQQLSEETEPEKEEGLQEVEEQVPGKTSIEKDFPQFMPEPMEEAKGIPEEPQGAAVHEITEEIVQEGRSIKSILASGNIEDISIVLVKELEFPGDKQEYTEGGMVERIGMWKQWMEKIVNA